MNKIRVLHIVGTMNCGGQETFIMNLYRKIDRSKVQFDFIVHTDEKCYYEDEILELGGEIYIVTPKSKNILKNIKDIYAILKNKKYKVVHRHSSSANMVLEIAIAKMLKIPIRIAHSHSTSTANKFTHKISRKILRKFATHLLACSKESGNWLYGNIESEKRIIINNGIDLQKYIYTNSTREKMRQQLGISNNTFCIGHVGRMQPVKNHLFLIELLLLLKKECKDIKLCLVGDGDLKEEIYNIAKEKDLVSQVMFLGVRSDVNELMMAFDLMVFPSLYEGFPITLIEAQATGLNCIVSDTIDKSVDMNLGLIEFLNLSNIEEWVKKIVYSYNSDRKINAISSEKIKEFDIVRIKDEIQNIYLSH